MYHHFSSACLRLKRIIMRTRLDRPPKLQKTSSVKVRNVVECRGRCWNGNPSFDGYYDLTSVGRIVVAANSCGVVLSYRTNSN
jgi:hypothetical protein